MNRLGVFLGCVLFGVAGQVAAQCSTGRVNDLDTFLINKTVCGTGVGPNAGDLWQEWHQAGSSGTLTEYAKGADPVDPTHDVGIWTATSGTSSTVTHKYTGGGSYTWVVFDNGGGSNYSFCTAVDGTEVANGPIVAGQVNCGF